jgi:hypothetical protein
MLKLRTVEEEVIVKVATVEEVAHITKVATVGDIIKVAIQVVAVCMLNQVMGEVLSTVRQVTLQQLHHLQQLEVVLLHHLVLDAQLVPMEQRILKIKMVIYGELPLMGL